MANYKPDLSCRNKFIPVNSSEQTLPGTFEYALCYIVENKLDLSGFYGWYNNDKTGAAAYPSHCQGLRNQYSLYECVGLCMLRSKSIGHFGSIRPLISV
jgi:hypothetical protein